MKGSSYWQEVFVSTSESTYWRKPGSGDKKLEKVKSQKYLVGKVLTFDSHLLIGSETFTKFTQRKCELGEVLSTLIKLT